MTNDLSGAVPAVKAILETATARPTMDLIGVEGARAAATQRTTNPPREDVAEVSEHSIPRPGGSIRVRCYLPDTVGEPLPLLVYAHAGGWILGDLDHSDHLCRRMCNRAGAVVVNVDYRLAPEHPYPAALDDCEAALRWALSEASDLPVDAERVALAGESSGGNLAAALALRLKRLDGPSIAYVLLLDPALDVEMDTPSWRSMGDLVPARQQMRWMWNLYLSGAERTTDPEASPAAAVELAGLPDTAIVTAGFDPLRDEGAEYAHRLRQAGVRVSYRCEEGLMHAFCNLGGAIPEGLSAFDRAVDEMMRSPAMIETTSADRARQ